MKGTVYPNNEVILKFIKKHKLISTEILNKFSLKTDKNQVNLGQEIFEKGLLSEDDFAWFSSQLFQLPNLELSNLPIAEEFFTNLPSELLARYLFFPITTIGDELIIGVVNPFLDGLYEIIDLIFSKQYQLNIVKHNEFDKLLHKLDHVIISESIPSIEFSDDLLDDPDFKDDETCIALSYYLILSLFKSKNRYIQLYPNNNEGEVKILEGMNLVKNIQLEKFQYHILLWRLKKLFNIRQFHDQDLNFKTVKDFFYEKQNYRINLSVYESTFGETAIISQNFSGIIIENTPEFFIKGSEDLSKVLRSGEVGFCFGYNNRLSKVFLVEKIQELLQNEFKDVVYLSSKHGQLLSYDIPTIFLEKQVKDFNSFSTELFKIYKYIIIEDYDLSKYITEIESLKKFIILVSSIDYFTPLKCLRILLDKAPWKITNISLSGLMMDIGDFNKKPFLIGDFFRVKNLQTVYNNDETWINELIKYRNSFLSQLKTSISLPPGLLEKVKIILGIEENEY